MLKVVLLAVATFVVAATAATPWSELTSSFSYEQYLSEQGKLASRREEGKMAMRRAIFEKELQSVLAHNADKTALFKMGLNQFSDWTQDEKNAQLLFKNKPFGDIKLPPADLTEPVSSKRTISGPQAFDWREVTSPTPVVTTVKDQGNCGSCWAHGTIESLESISAIKQGRTFVLSQGQFVACVPDITVHYRMNDQNMTQVMGGCGGYMPHAAIDWMAKSPMFNGGVAQEWQIPYQFYGYEPFGKNYSNQKCEKWMTKVKPAPTSFTNITGYNWVGPNDDAKMEEALLMTGPVVIAMAVYDDFFGYTKGVYHSKGCEGKEGVMPPSHIVNLVGWGFDKELDAHYWILRNSWNANWGEAGYARMLRNASAPCGEMLLPANASTIRDDWRPLKACGMCGILGYALQPTI